MLTVRCAADDLNKLVFIQDNITRVLTTEDLNKIWITLP